MDSVEYSGLRQYLLSQKPRKDRVHRELWQANGATYHTYRKYLHHVREFGFPDDKGLHELTGPRSSKQKSSCSNEESRRDGLAFSGVDAVVESCQSPITVMSYEYLSNSRIAFGTLNGGVWILTLSADGQHLEKLLNHGQEVRDIDWSLDNSLILSCSLNGCVCLNGVNPPSVFRKWRAKTRTTCCKFLLLNQNLVIVGGGGSLYIFNCSTGAQIQRITITPSPVTYLTALACTNSQIFLGDSNGALRTYKSSFKNNVLQLTLLGSGVSHPYGKSKTTGVAAIHIRSYSNICHGQAILVSYEDATIAIYKTSVAATARLELCTKLCLRPTGRRIKAVWCPVTDIDQPEHIAVGGDHANLHIYDFVSCKECPLLVNTLSAHEAPVLTVCWSFDGQGLISGDENGTIVVWKKAAKRHATWQSYG